MTFKDRIASYFLVATASVIAVVFAIIYFIVSTTVYSNLDSALVYESHKHLKDIIIKQDSIYFDNNALNQEREHKEAEVIPFFLQIVDTLGEVLDRSSNLKVQKLQYIAEYGNGESFNSRLSDKAIRQIQIPFTSNGNIKGYLLTAVPLEGTILVVENLRNVLFILFPLVLILLFFVARYLAGKNIQPIVNITETTNRITKNNLSERVKLPETKDELYTLSNSINELLDRMQNAFEREKQFTNDASHELRTPLSVIKGTLEVLVRKPRKEEEYKEKINYCISEIDNMSERVDQLLLLARFDKANISLRKETMPVLSLIDNAIYRHRKLIEEKNIHILIEDESQAKVETDPYYVDMILENIISNSAKYSHRDGAIKIITLKENGKVIIEVTDYGVGIKEEDLESVFNPFFRSNSLNHKHIAGSGLGLSIVKKASEVLKIKVKLQNHSENGIKAQIFF
ncbi:MAG: ATP-binding protein [Melioribacteraceae bacterium]|nr:ATP-binding protein [Melioribacteraceae bacterium]